MFAHFFDHLAQQLRQHTSLRTISFDMRRLSQGNYRYPALFIDMGYVGLYAGNTGNYNLSMTLVTAPLPTMSWQTPSKPSQGTGPGGAGVPSQGLSHTNVVTEIYQALQYFKTSDWTSTARAAWQQAQEQDPSAGVKLGAFLTCDYLYNGITVLPQHLRRKLGAWGMQLSLGGSVLMPAAPSTSASAVLTLRTTARLAATGGGTAADDPGVVLPTPTPASL